MHKTYLDFENEKRCCLYFVIIDNVEYTNALTLDLNTCKFHRCIFQRARLSGNFVYIKDASLNCSFVSCLFLQVNTGSYVLYLATAAEGIQEKCCYSEETSNHIFRSDNLPSLSVKSTACTNSNSYTPRLSSSKEFANFLNNHSYLSKNDGPCCYCHDIIPRGETNNCFFSGMCCTGTRVACLDSASDGCTLLKFNFINNSDSVGYFHLGYGFATIIRDSVIMFNATSNTHKFLYNSNSKATLRIEDTFIVTSKLIKAQSQVKTKNVVETNSAPTHSPFHCLPQCSYFSFCLTIHSTISQKDPILFFVFVPILV